MSIQRMCEAAGVSRAGFYRDWQERQPAEAEVAIRDAVQRAALAQRTYGYRRITRLVQRDGVMVSERVVRRILRSDNLLEIRKLKFVATPDTRHNFAIYTNLAQYVAVTTTNQLWVADITYLRLRREFVYLAVVLDVCSRKVIGWAAGRSLQTALPLLALNRAIVARKPGPGLVHHSDRGTQYASNEYVQRLETVGMHISMSRPARPWENAYCESFMRTLKAEEISHPHCSTLEELEQSIGEYVDEFYNRHRLHSALGYRSPEEFEQALIKQPKLPLKMSFPRHEEIYPDV
jgi:transposase InsO family protein